MQTVQSIDESSKLYSQGKALMLGGNFAGAIKSFEASVRLYPHFKTLEFLGECYVESNRFSDAIVSLAAASSLSRGLRAPLLLAELFVSLEDIHRAKDVAKMVLQRDPEQKRAKAILELKE